MNFKITMIEYALKLLVSGRVFQVITESVASLMDVDKTNDEKREEVKSKVMPFVTEFGKFFLSTAIAFAVDYYKTKYTIDSGVTNGD